jgi:hypothetical protein
VPIIARADGIVVTGNPGITVPGGCISGSCIAIHWNRWWRSIIITAAETHSEKNSGTSKYASASQQEKGQNFCFHLKLLAAVICKSFAKSKLLKDGVTDATPLAFVHQCGGFTPPVRRVPRRPRP